MASSERAVKGVLLGREWYWVVKKVERECMYSAFLPERPADRRVSIGIARTSCGVGPSLPALGFGKRASNLARMEAAAAPETCWDMIPCEMDRK